MDRTFAKLPEIANADPEGNSWDEVGPWSDKL